jgi:hypothetical protein
MHFTGFSGFYAKIMLWLGLILCLRYKAFSTTE